MIKFENTEVMGWEAAIRGMRNPLNSWEKSDSGYKCPYLKPEVGHTPSCCRENMCIGPNDLKLMKRLRNAGTDHRKFMRMIIVYVDITAPLYWWKEFDTYKVGTVVNSCSTMHKIHAKEFTLDDFSCEHLIHAARIDLGHTIDALNFFRRLYLHGGMAKDEDGNLCGYGEKSKEIWWQMTQLLPSSYNQKRTVMMDYEILASIYKSRRNHKLDEWAEHTESTCPVNKNTICSNPKEFLLCEDCSVGKGFCDWIKTLPYSELITGKEA